VRLRIDADEIDISQLPTGIRRPNIDIDLIVGLRKRRYTLGDIVSFSFNISSVSQLTGIVDALYGDNTIDNTLEKLQEIDSSEAFAEKPLHYMSIFAENVFSKRHELVHEFSETMFLPSFSGDWEASEVRNDIMWGITLLRCLQKIKKERYQPEAESENEEDVDENSVFSEMFAMQKEVTRLQTLCRKRIDRLYRLLGHERADILRVVVYSYQDYSSASAELEYELFRPGTMASLAAMSAKLKFTRRLLSDLNELLRNLKQ
jgi:hypothetical protein